MDYLTAKETAKRWHVSDRQVARLIAEGRVPGAQKFGVSWMIPADAQKPMDPRKARPEADPSPYLTCVLLSAVTPMPADDPDAGADALPDEAQRAQFRAELAYLRGDYEAVKTHYRRVSPRDATYLCAANITICAAMCTRDYPLFKEITASVQTIEAHSPSAEARSAASLLPVLAAVCMNAPRLAPDWLVRGELDGFPADARPMLVFMRIKYLYSIQDYAGVLAAAQMARAIFQRRDGVTLVDVYLTCFCACGCYPLGRLDDTRAYLDQSVGLCEKGGFVSPLGEYTACVGGLLSGALKKAAPAFRQAVETHIEDTWTNWLFFHNEFARDNVSLVLSPREYQLAVLLKEGKTYAEAAQQLDVSVGRLKNLVSIVYEKLGISKKAEISRFVY